VIGLIDKKGEIVILLNKLLIVKYLYAIFDMSTYACMLFLVLKKA